MALTIGDLAPDFSTQTTDGPMRFHEWVGDGWAVLFSHPRDFTPVCTTELGYMAQIKPEFDRRGVKIAGLSTDPLENHEQWAQDITHLLGTAVNYPIISDPDFAIATAYGMLPADVCGDPTNRTAAQNATLRNVFVVGPDKTIRLVLIYPMSTGRNFDEILRALDALKLTESHQLSTPAQWQPGDPAILPGAISDEQAREQFPGGFEQPLPYMRVVELDARHATPA